NKKRQHTALPVHLADSLSHAPRSHPLVKTFGVGIGLNLDRLKSQCPRPVKSMSEYCASDSLFHRRRQDPKMLQTQMARITTQRIESKDATLHDRDVRFVSCDEFWLNGQNLAPTFHPGIGIAPGPLCSQRDPGQRLGVIWLGSCDVHGP